MRYQLERAMLTVGPVPCLHSPRAHLSSLIADKPIKFVSDCLRLFFFTHHVTAIWPVVSSTWRENSVSSKTCNLSINLRHAAGKGWIAALFSYILRVLFLFSSLAHFFWKLFPSDFLSSFYAQYFFHFIQICTFSTICFYLIVSMIVCSDASMQWRGEDLDDIEALHTLPRAPVGPVLLLWRSFRVRGPERFFSNIKSYTVAKTQLTHFICPNIVWVCVCG